MSRLVVMHVHVKDRRIGVALCLYLVQRAWSTIARYRMCAYAGVSVRLSSVDLRPHHFVGAGAPRDWRLNNFLERRWSTSRS